MADILDTTIGLILAALLLFPHIIPSAVFNTPFRLSLASDVSKKNSFCHRRVPVQATERILLVDLAAIQRKLLALQRGVSD